MELKDLKQTNCKACTRYFLVFYDDASEGKNCKMGVNLDKNVFSCPHYKERANWGKVADKIKETPKDIERINRRRARGK